MLIFAILSLVYTNSSNTRFAKSKPLLVNLILSISTSISSSPTSLFNSFLKIYKGLPIKSIFKA